MSDKTAPARLLESAARAIEKSCDGWYLFGAQAVIIWGRPRLTSDVDVTIQLRSGHLADFLRDMQTEGFSLRVPDPEPFLARTRVIPFLHTSTQMPLDIVLAGPGLEESFVQRAITVPIEGLAVPVASPEDLIVMKILAGRPKDLEDVRSVLTEQSGNVDVRYMRSVLEILEQALGQSDLLPKLEFELMRASRQRRP